MTLREANLTASSSADREPELIETAGTARLHLTLATADYDHVRDLTTGAVHAEGILFTAFVLPVEEIFYRFIKNREWDVSEMSFGPLKAVLRSSESPSFRLACSGTRHSTCARIAASPIPRIWRANAWVSRNGHKPPASMRADF